MGSGSCQGDNGFPWKAHSLLRKAVHIGTHGGGDGDGNDDGSYDDDGDGHDGDGGDGGDRWW